MNKISSRDIQLLVAGALAVTGFRALLWIHYDFFVLMDSVLIGGAIFTGLVLPIGIGILLGRTSALFWAQVYLWLGLIVSSLLIPYGWHSFPAKAGRMTLSLALEMLVSAVLLGLIYWSKSERFRRESEG